MVGKAVYHMSFKLCALLLVLLDGSLIQLLLRGSKSAHEQDTLHASGARAASNSR